MKEMKVESSATRGKSRAEIKNVRAVKASEIPTSALGRINFTMPMVEKVLGGGIARGGLFLFGGDPGVGKSTLLLRIASRIKEKVLYISAEESLEQVKDRALRISSTLDNLLFLAESNLDAIINVIEQEKPILVVVDSIQTVYDPAFPSTAGSLVQVRESTLRLQTLAKQKNISFLIVSHVTKDGNIAGPRILEHIVDGVFYLEKENDEMRLLRSVKNRFGPTTEVAVLQMRGKGISEIAQPEGVFLVDRVLDVPGAVVTTVAEGSRIILVEIEALVVPTNFGYPRRSAVGLHPQRLELILAALERRAKVSLRSFDVFVKATAGFVAREAATDLAVALALVSAQKNKTIPSRWCVFGEVGLLGEIRQPKDVAARRQAAAGLGFNKFVSAKYLREAIGEVIN
jgi:DNA repair protein RadA/Sms